MRAVAFALAGLFVTVSAAVFAQADTAPVPGTRLSLSPPPGFVASRQFPGFQKLDSGSSIVVTEIDGPVAQITTGFTEEGLASKGMTLLSEETVALSGRKARLLRVTQVAQGTEFQKWMAVLGDQTRTAIVIATFPSATSDSLAEPLRSSLLSARWDPEHQVGTFEGLPFRVIETATLKVASRVANTILMNATGTTAPLGPGEPLVVVGASLGDSTISDVEAFARQRLQQTAGISEALVVGNRSLTLAGLPAFELIALAKDRETSTPLTVFQVLAAEGPRYFIIQGFVARPRTEALLTDVRKVADSFEIVR